ncbi:hypothetical protein SARC_00616 [Sphaeroforma arctica JP610]|uniref:Uncharacterized protein n=1 Tax=Sphaeroforma arctica JP610 TaxID=667725 RepID=A0A0L0GEG7_9EUKA|nr:hypothetical protein SARC_00616 [Sphaeroforma arctica JP610]KNC87289.1 hypothetical protein SARC_00616 [Sphaeroforma arctica JP610]|eukprot:XP_014161191.1 hypothetical protein SARC_00616 [Sphaeroforma arctica JP610]
MMLHLIPVVLVSVCVAVEGVCTSNSFYLSGADDYFGISVGTSGARTIDGCYKELDHLTDTIGYSKFGAYEDGPVLASIEWSPSVGHVWLMYHYEAEINAEFGNFLSGVSELILYAMKPEIHPADQEAWYQQVGRSPVNITDELSVACGCNVSPTPKPVLPKGVCKSNSFYLSGADDYFGIAGGVSGAGALDGCYKELDQLSDTVGYSKFGGYEDGPVLARIE